MYIAWAQPERFLKPNCISELFRYLLNLFVRQSSNILEMIGLTVIPLKSLVDNVFLEDEDLGIGNVKPPPNPSGT
jgi:hypothetical protein